MKVESGISVYTHFLDMESDDNTGELDRFEGKPENYLIYLDMFGQNFVKPGPLDSVRSAKALRCSFESAMEGKLIRQPSRS